MKIYACSKSNVIRTSGIPHLFHIQHFSGMANKEMLAWSNFKLFLKLFIYLFIYLFWLRWVFVIVQRLSLVVASGGYSSLQCAGFSLRWLLLLQSMGSRWAGFSSCGTHAQ